MMGTLVGPPLLLAATGLAIALSASSLPSFALFRCGLQTWFRVPCPFCGGTRALAALGRGELSAAFHWNPLVAAIPFLVLGVFLLWLSDRLFRTGFVPRAAIRTLDWRIGWTAAGAMSMNWLYLLWMLPD